MRIVYLHQYFTTPQMSGGTRSYEMARRLVRRGHEVHMVTSDRSRTRGGWRESHESGIRVHWCPVEYGNEMGFKRRMVAFAKFAWLAARRAASLSADVVFATSTPLTIALPAVWAARKQSVPMVFEVRDLWPEVPIAIGALRSRPAIAAARRLERFAYENAAHVVALSPGMKEGVLATGYPSERVTVIPNSCDLDLFGVDASAGRSFRQAHRWLQDRPLVVYTGALGLINGVDWLARLAAVVARRDPEIRFLVLGSGREQTKVRDTAVALGVLDRNFFMLPPVSKAQMPAVLSAADIATSTVVDIPQTWANSANKVFDALAAGCPIAINHEGWLAELIRQTGCGLVLDVNHVEVAAERLTEALRNPLWLAGARAAAAHVAEERFDREKLAALLAEVLENAVSARPLRAAA